MPEFAPEILPISRKEKRKISVDCSGNLEGAAVISGVPDVTEVTTSHLTIDDIEVSTGMLTINDNDVAAGKAIQFTVDARGAGVKPQWTYAILLEFDTAGGERVAGAIRLATD